MNKGQCYGCDRMHAPLSQKGFCDSCQAEFDGVSTMYHCAIGLCVTPLSCKVQKKCTQLKTAMEIVRNEHV